MDARELGAEIPAPATIRLGQMSASQRATAGDVKADEPAAFGDYEWLALFPFVVGPSVPLADGPPPPDPAADLRALKPRDLKSLLTACKEAHRPLIGILLRAYASLFLGDFAAQLLGMILRVPAVAAALVLAANSTRYSARNLWLGGFAVAVQLLWGPAVSFSHQLRNARALFRGRHKTFVDNAVSSFSVANMFTWSLLTKQRPDSPLLAHREADDACTCRTCAGDVNRVDALSRFVDLFSNGIIHILIVPFLLWTPAVAFASSFWSTPWAMAAALCLISPLPLIWQTLGRVLNFPGLPALHYESRLRVRASTLALDDLLARYRRLVPLGATPEHPQREPYLDLCRTLSGYWSSTGRFAPTLIRSYVIAHVCAIVLCFVLNAAAGCITAWQLAALAYFVAFTSSVLVNVAAQNAGVTSITELWARAQGALRALALECGPGEPRTAIRDHDRVLAGFVDRGRLFRAKMFGLIVDFGLLRALAATAITIAVGLFGIFRGAGLRITLETFCPAG